MSRPVLYKTIDGGQTWTRTYQFENYTGRQWLKHIQFVSETEGYVVIEPFNVFGEHLKIYRTTNGGQNWNLVFGIYGSYMAADFSSNLMIIAKSNPQGKGVLVSTDGLNWQFHQDGLSYSPEVVLANNGRLIVGISSYFYSDDLGINWSAVDTTGLGEDFCVAGALTNCNISSQADNIYAIASTWDGNNTHPGIIRSLNNGTSWQWIVQPVYMPDQSGQTYGICYWGEYLYIAHNLSIYRLQVGNPVNNDDPVAPALDLNLTCYPNPFRGSTTIKFNQIENSPTTISIYNIKGQLIRTLVSSQKQSPGEHIIAWDGRDDGGLPVVAGIYLCRLETGRTAKARKLILLR